MTALALAFAGALATGVEAQPRHPPYRVAAHRAARAPGDVIVHTGRSYLDPGPTAPVGTEDRYFSDTLPYSFTQVGAPFTSNTAGFELLPSPRDPPGRPEPLFQF